MKQTSDQPHRVQALLQELFVPHQNKRANRAAGGAAPSGPNAARIAGLGTDGTENPGWCYSDVMVGIREWRVLAGLCRPQGRGGDLGPE